MKIFLYKAPIFIFNLEFFASFSIKFEPIKPAPPVTIIKFFICFLLGGDIHVSRALNYGPRCGYDLWQFIVSPLHDSTIASLDVPHPNLVHHALEPHVFLKLVADTTVQPATLSATWINRDGKRIFQVETNSDELAAAAK